MHNLNGLFLRFNAIYVSKPRTCNFIYKNYVYIVQSLYTLKNMFCNKVHFVGIHAVNSHVSHDELAMAIRKDTIQARFIGTHFNCAVNLVEKT